MARKKTTAKAITETVEATPENTPVAPPPAEQTRPPVEQAAAGKPAHAADPQSKISISLSDHQGGPEVHLLRSQKFNQMQIRFDGEQPAEEHLAVLKQAGWKDRTEAEGVWTKQIDRDARWQSVQQMEREFKAVANAIRKDKGLEPAMAGLAVA